MSFFRSRSKKFTITAKDPQYKVQYLGNVHTSFMKGEGCADKALAVLWRCYLQNMSRGAEMEISVCAFGLKARTKTSGTVEYRTHRIPYCIAHPGYPKVFAWVYKHEGKRMRMDLRCHAVICKNQTVAKAMALKLHENMQTALTDYLKEKNQKQRARLTLQRTNSAQQLGQHNSNIDSPIVKPRMSFLPLRQEIKSTATNFKPGTHCLPGAPRLRSIAEGQEPEIKTPELCEYIEEEDEEEEEEEEEEVDLKPKGDKPGSPSSDDSGFMNDWSNGNHLEVGNNVEELKRDVEVQKCLIYGEDDSG